MSLLPCLACGLTPLLRRWRICPACGFRLRQLTLRIPFSRSPRYAEVIAAAQALHGYRVEGSGRDLVHLLRWDVRGTDRLRPILRASIGWRGTEVLLGGIEVPAGWVSRLVEAYRPPKAWEVRWLGRDREIVEVAGGS